MRPANRAYQCPARVGPVLCDFQGRPSLLVGSIQHEELHARKRPATSRRKAANNRVGGEESELAVRHGGPAVPGDSEQHHGKACHRSVSCPEDVTSEVTVDLDSVRVGLMND